MRASSSSKHHSCCSDSNGGYDKWSNSWSGEGSYYSGGPHSDGSWEDDSFCDSHTRNDGDRDSVYDSTSSDQSVRGYMEYDPSASDEDSDSKEVPGKAEPPSESIEEEATSPSPRLSCPLSSGSITALWGPRTSDRWHQQMQTVADGTNSLFYSWVPSICPVYATTPRCGQRNITSSSAPCKMRTF